TPCTRLITAARRVHSRCVTSASAASRKRTGSDLERNGCTRTPSSTYGPSSSRDESTTSTSGPPATAARNMVCTTPSAPALWCGGYAWIMANRRTRQLPSSNLIWPSAAETHRRMPAGLCRTSHQPATTQGGSGTGRRRLHHTEREPGGGVRVQRGDRVAGG